MLYFSLYKKKYYKLLISSPSLAIFFPYNKIRRFDLPEPAAPIINIFKQFILLISCESLE